MILYRIQNKDSYGPFARFIEDDLVLILTSHVVPTECPRTILESKKLIRKNGEFVQGQMNQFPEVKNMDELSCACSSIEELDRWFPHYVQVMLEGKGFHTYRFDLDERKTVRGDHQTLYRRSDVDNYIRMTSESSYVL